MEFSDLSEVARDREAVLASAHGAVDGIPSVRFHVPGPGVPIGWTSDIGDTCELILVNVGNRDMTVRGCIDYTTARDG